MARLPRCSIFRLSKNSFTSGSDPRGGRAALGAVKDIQERAGLRGDLLCVLFGVRNRFRAEVERPQEAG